MGLRGKVKKCHLSAMKGQRPISRSLYTGIENYDHVDLDAGEVFFANALARHECPCCGIPLARFEYELPEQKILGPGTSQLRWLQLEICPNCGWWHFEEIYALHGGLVGKPNEIVRARDATLTHAVQAEIDIDSDNLSLASLRQHLLRRWEDRKLISAQQAEDLVAALLKEHHGGEVSRLTANANTADGGVDLYISHDNGRIQRAVQVKRRISTDVETVKDVRNFVGAMVLEGVDQGIFVTTASRFSKPAREAPGKAERAKHKLSLELIDGERLLEMLRVTTSCREVTLPYRVNLDQEWKSATGRTVLAYDLFIGDIGRACRL